jgi:hypothetical protein
VDSGVRRGSDIVKCLALGAKAVLTGRATLYGTAAGGQAGAEGVPGELAGVAFTRNRHPFYIATLAEPFLQIYKGAYAPSDHS